MLLGAVDIWTDLRRGNRYLHVLDITFILRYTLIGTHQKRGGTMAEDDKNETIKCTVSCPECGAEMICTHEDPKHEGKHRCEKGHEWT